MDEYKEEIAALAREENVAETIDYERISNIIISIGKENSDPCEDELSELTRFLIYSVTHTELHEFILTISNESNFINRLIDFIHPNDLISYILISIIQLIDIPELLSNEQLHVIFARSMDLFLFAKDDKTIQTILVILIKMTQIKSMHAEFDTKRFIKALLTKNSQKNYHFFFEICENCLNFVIYTQSYYLKFMQQMINDEVFKNQIKNYSLAKEKYLQAILKYIKRGYSQMKEAFDVVNEIIDNIEAYESNIAKVLEIIQEIFEKKDEKIIRKFPKIIDANFSIHFLTHIYFAEQAALVLDIDIYIFDVIKSTIMDFVKSGYIDCLKSLLHNHCNFDIKNKIYNVLFIMSNYLSISIVRDIFNEEAMIEELLDFSDDDDLEFKIPLLQCLEKLLIAFSDDEQICSVLEEARENLT